MSAADMPLSPKPSLLELADDLAAECQIALTALALGRIPDLRLVKVALDRYRAGRAGL